MPQEIEITIPVSIRVSKDVGEIGRYVAQKKGHSSVKSAIEAVFRAHWRDYVASGSTQPNPTPELPPQVPINAVAALDGVV